MRANRYEAESKLRRIATKLLLVTAIRNGFNTILDHFDRKIISIKSSTLAPYGKHKIVIFTHFLNKFSRLFDDHNNQHSPQQGVGKFDNEYAQIMCRVGCSNIKCV